MDQVNKTSEILTQALKIPVLHLIKIDFLTKYLMENAVQIAFLSRFQNFLGEHTSIKSFTLPAGT